MTTIKQYKSVRFYFGNDEGERDNLLNKYALEGWKVVQPIIGQNHFTSGWLLERDVPVTEQGPYR